MSIDSRLALIGQVEGTAEQCLLRPDPDLKLAVTNSRDKGLPSIAVTPLQGQYLSLLCQLVNAQRVLEIGALGGYSTMWMAKTGAHVTSIEINKKHRDVALDNLQAAGLKADIILGAALDVLPTLATAEKFDFVFIDAAWGEQWEYFDWAAKLVRRGGIIYVDNVVLKMIMNDDSSQDTLLAKIGRDERVKATLVPTLSAAKRSPGGVTVDGFVLAVVQ